MAEIKKPGADNKLREQFILRQRAYRTTFNADSEADRIVMQDLSRFCRADESTFHQDPRIHAVLEGRREVFLRIMDHIGMNSEDLFIKYTKGAK